MPVQLRLPNITGSDKEQLAQIRSYLYQIIPQLEFALNTVSTSSNVVTTIPKSQLPANLTSAASAESTFNSIKALIIKSADIVDAYYEEINQRLDGAYVSESDFGVFAEHTSQEIQANSSAITQNFHDTQVIIQTEIDALSTELKGYTDIAAEDLGIALDDARARLDSTEESLETAKADMTEAIQKVSESLSETDKLFESAKAQLEGSLEDLAFTISGLENIMLGVTAYIRSGILYYTDGGTPVYGIEIGQEVEADGENVFKKFSRFTSEKLSFYDSNDNEVAYISDKKLYIGQAEITISLQIGGFIDLVLPSGDVVTKWIGG